MSKEVKVYDKMLRKLNLIICEKTCILMHVHISILILNNSKISCVNLNTQYVNTYINYPVVGYVALLKFLK